MHAGYKNVGEFQVVGCGWDGVFIEPWSYLKWMCSSVVLLALTSDCMPFKPCGNGLTNLSAYSKFREYSVEVFDSESIL